MKFARAKLRSAGPPKKARAALAAIAARDEGLLDCGPASSLFRSIGIGEERATSYVPRIGQGKAKGQLRTRWWAPARLVKINLMLQLKGFSSKQRAKVLRCLAEGKDPPERAWEVMADYTERLFEQR